MRLKKTFQAVYFAKERDEPEPDWEASVMRRVRQAGPYNSATAFWPAFEHLVWRFAPVCCFFVFVLTALFMSMDLDRGHDYLAILSAELEKPTLSELYGLGG
jgi:hypothetical protein